MTPEEAGIGPRRPHFEVGPYGVYIYLDTWLMLIASRIPWRVERPGIELHLRLFPQSLPTPECEEIWAIVALTLTVELSPPRLRLRTSSQADQITSWLIGRRRR